jgi:hypothetical protein
VTAIATNAGGASVADVTSFTAAGAPTLTVTGPIGTTVTTTPTVSGTATPGSTIEIRDSNNVLLCTTTAQPNGNFACTLTSPLPVGPNTLRVTASGPGGSVSQSISFTTDDCQAQAPTLKKS